MPPGQTMHETVKKLEVLALMALIAFAVACQDDVGGQPWQLADDAGEVQSEPDRPDVVDTTDTAEEPDGCTFEINADVGYIPYTGTRFLHVYQVPVIASEKIYFQRDVEVGERQFERRLVEFDPNTDTERVLIDDIDNHAVAAAAEGYVVTYGLKGEVAGELTIYEPLDGTSRKIPLRHRQYPFWTSQVGEPVDFFDARRLLMQDGEGDLHLMNSRDWVGIGTADFFGRRFQATRPVLTDAGFAFDVRAEDNQSADIYEFRVASDREVQVTDAADYHNYPYADGPDLYWASDSAVYRQTVGEEPTVIFEGTCGAPHAAGGRAVFACNPPDLEPREFGAPLGTSVYVFDGDETRLVHTFEENTFALATRMGANGIAWLEYDDPTEFWGLGTQGRVVYMDIGSGQRVELGEVGSPCWTCGRMSPPYAFRMEGNLIAWNYAISSDDEPAGSPEFGYATIGKGGCP